MGWPVATSQPDDPVCVVLPAEVSLLVVTPIWL